MSEKENVKSKGTWAGRSLTNYKSMHARTAEEKGVTKELENCTTLTAARRILFGYKKGNRK